MLLIVNHKSGLKEFGNKSKNTNQGQELHYASNSRSRYEEDRKIEQGIALLVRREPDGKNFFQYWACNEFDHFSSKCPKREKMYKRNFQPRRPRDCLYENEDDESEERVQSESDDELGFVGIREENL